MSRYKRERQNDENDLKAILIENGLDVRAVKLLEPLCDGNDQCVITFYRAVKEEVDTAREILEAHIGTIYDSVRVRDTEQHLIVILE